MDYLVSQVSYLLRNVLDQTIYANLVAHGFVLLVKKASEDLLQILPSEPRGFRELFEHVHLVTVHLALCVPRRPREYDRLFQPINDPLGNQMPCAVLVGVRSLCAADLVSPAE